MGLRRVICYAGSHMLSFRLVVALGLAQDAYFRLEAFAQPDDDHVIRLVRDQLLRRYVAQFLHQLFEVRGVGHYVNHVGSALSGHKVLLDAHRLYLGSFIGETLDDWFDLAIGGADAEFDHLADDSVTKECHGAEVVKDHLNGMTKVGASGVGLHDVYLLGIDQGFQFRLFLRQHDGTHDANTALCSCYHLRVGSVDRK